MKASPIRESTATSLCRKVTGIAIAISLLVACSAGSNADTGASKTVESVYTSLDLDDCEVLETFKESNGSALRCEGYQEIPLYVTKSDLRFDVDAGIPNEEWTTSGRPFNSIGDTVEWRIHDGEPVAAILRFNFETDSAPNSQSSDLAVFSIGQEGSPGCLVDWVRADAQPSQNVAARQVADQRAEGFDCRSATSAEDIQLPDAVIGTFDTSQANCSERMTFSRLTTTQDRFDFYYGYADIDSVTFQDGGYNIDATLFQLEGVPEVRPEAVEYRIEPNAQDDGIQFLRKSLPEDKSLSSLVRCNEP